MGIPFVGRRGLSRSKEYQRKKAADRIPEGYTHPKKAFLIGYALIALDGLIAAALHQWNPPLTEWLPIGETAVALVIIGVLLLILVVSWSFFYNGWQYDYLLFQQLDNIRTPSKFEGFIIALVGPVVAPLYLLVRPSGY